MLRLNCVSLALCCFFSTAAAPAAPPNLVFIFADDQSFETLHALGNEEIETPNLDRLVREGTTFTHAYNMGSWTGAVCVASRTMLNTGRFLWRANDLQKKLGEEKNAGRLWSTALSQAGYETYMTGKWHVSIAPEQIFDHVTHVRAGMPNQTPAGYDRPQEGRPDAWSPSDPKFGGFWEGGKHWSEVLGDDSVAFIEQAGREKKPFFMYLAFNAPHDPRQSPREFVDKYPLEKISLPKNFLAEYPYKEQIGCGQGLRDEKLAPFPRTEQAVKVHRQEYYAIITHLDVQVGRILDALEQQGLAENTYVFFTADHGLAVGHHGLLGKQNLYDHSVRVPFLFRGPKIQAGAKIDAPIYLQDVMPTTLALAGIEKPAHVEFKSLLPLIKDSSAPHYEAIYGAYLNLQRMITHDGWKLIVYPQAKKLRLYDLNSDPLEMNDLSEDASQQHRISELAEKLLQLQKETGDPLDLSALFDQRKK